MLILLKNIHFIDMNNVLVSMYVMCLIELPNNRSPYRYTIHSSTINPIIFALNYLPHEKNKSTSQKLNWIQLLICSVFEIFIYLKINKIKRSFIFKTIFYEINEDNLVSPMLLNLHELEEHRVHGSGVQAGDADLHHRKHSSEI